MLGWEIYVARQSNIVQEGSPKSGAVIAVWMAGMGGIDWIDALTKQGKATDSGGNGYPCRWTVTVLEIRRALRNGLPESTSPPIIGDDYMLPADWSKFRKFDRDLLDMLIADEVLVIEAWDQS